MMTAKKETNILAQAWEQLPAEGRRQLKSLLQDMAALQETAIYGHAGGHSSAKGACQGPENTILKRR
jgi:hypothetical protein